MNRYGYNLKSTGMLAAMVVDLRGIETGDASMVSERPEPITANAADIIIDSVQLGSPSAEPTTRPTPQGNRAQRRARMRRK